MRRQSNFKPLMRAVAVMGVVVAIVSGVTFAALQSQQAVLSGSTISTATADLKISLNGTTFATSSVGFSFSDIIPGGSAVPTTGNNFYLKNLGTTSVLTKVAVSSVPTNPNNVDLSKVSIIITRTPGGSPQTFTLAQLISNYASGGVQVSTALAINEVGQYKVQASMTADAFSGPSASLGNIDLVFIGSSI